MAGTKTTGKKTEWLSFKNLPDTITEPLRGLRVTLILILPLALLFLSSSCAPKKMKTPLDRVYELDPGGDIYVNPVMKTNPPHTIAVLPFESLVGEGCVEGSQRFLLGLRRKKKPDTEVLTEEMRMSFFGQLAQLPIETIHPTRVDTLLKAHDLMSRTALKTLPLDQMKTALDVDAVIFGEVTHLDYIYGFLYSQLAVGLRLKMVSTHTGKTLWRFKDTRRDHTVRIALDPISMAVGLFQAGFALRSINMTRAMDEICREAAAHFPCPIQ